MKNSNDNIKLNLVIRLKRETMERCKKLVSAVDNLAPSELDELFKLLHKNKCPYTRNNHGIFVNLSWLSEDILEQIETYVQFCKKSQSEVQKYETLCDGLRKNNITIVSSLENANDNMEKASLQPLTTSLGSGASTMKFYLLKKKYGKINHVSQSLKNELEPDDI